MPYQIVDITPTVDTTALDAGDVIFDATACAIPGLDTNQPCELVSVRLMDLDDNAVGAVTMHFFSGAVTFGTADSAPSITDADMAHHLGYIALSGTFIDVGGSKVVEAVNIGLVCRPAAGTSTIYVAATTAGTPTNSQGGIKVRLGFKW